MFFDFIILCAFVGLVVWGLSLLPIPAPFQKLILVAGIIIVVLAFFQDVLGFNLLGHVLSLRSY